MESSSCLLDVDAFPRPSPSFQLDFVMKKAGKEKEREEGAAAVAAETALMIEMFNCDSKRVLDEKLECVGPNKKVKRVATVDNDTAACDKAPKYPPHMKRKPVVIEEGKCLPHGVESFLCSRKKKRDFLVRFSGERVPVTSLRGKHILICGFLLPLPADGEEANVCRAMIASYPKLFNLHNFEMVVVAKMRDRGDFSNKEDEEVTFNHFFSSFPCLAIPFSDSRSRDFICGSLGLTCPGDLMANIVVNDKQVVLWKDVNTFFLWYGALFFPFTNARLEALSKEQDELKIRLDPIYMELITPDDEINQVSRARTPLSLSELLGCQPHDLLWKCTAAWEEKMSCGGANNENVRSASNDSVIQKCSYTGNDDDKVASVLDLSRKKLVGLYLCIDGQFMAQLYEVHQQCLAQGLEFEIVLVFLPFFGDFTSFFHDAKRAIEKLQISSWWVAPYNDESSRRLWLLCERAWSDKLFILDAASKAGELEGRGVICNLGGIEAYPFTKQSLVEKKLSHLRSITLESLFDESSEGVYNIVFSDQGPPWALHVSELKGKNILLYLDYYDALSSSDRGNLFEDLKQYYDRIKKAYPNSEVVFIPRDLCKRCRRRAPRVPWLMLHPSAAASVMKRLFWDGDNWSRLVAFGEDGLLRCRRARKHLTNAGVSDSLFADSLREETLLGVDEALSAGDM